MSPNAPTIESKRKATYQDIRENLFRLYHDDPRPWLVGFSGGKDSTLLAALIFDVVLSISPTQRNKNVAILCTDTRVEIPAIVEMVLNTLEQMRRFSQKNGLLNILRDDLASIISRN